MMKSNLNRVFFTWLQFGKKNKLVFLKHNLRQTEIAELDDLANTNNIYIEEDAYRFTLTINKPPILRV